MHVTRDGVLLAFHDPVLDRVTDRQRRDRARSAYAEVARGAGRRPGARCRRWPSCFDAFPRRPVQHRPEVRRRGRRAGRLRRGPRRLGPGAGRLVLARRRTTRFRALTGGRVPTSAPPRARSLAFRLLPSGRLADLLTGGGVRGAADPAPPRPARRSPPPGSYAAPTPPAGTCTSGPSTTPTRCASCSTGASTACSPTAPTYSRPCSSSAASGGSRS